MDFKILKSEIDSSVNFVRELGKGQALEARYVRRHGNYVACYLSTQTGCAQNCRMCHLTATGQNHPRDARYEEVVRQAEAVLQYYQTQPKATTVHYNFMARGEPLTSDTILNQSESLFLRLGTLARNHNLLPRFLISTIMPESLSTSLDHLFPIIHPEIYYSLYSLQPKFRKKWLPHAMDPEKALGILTKWQHRTKKIVRIHHALIKDENDWALDVLNIAHTIKKIGLRADFTLVRYNPPGIHHSEESNLYEMHKKILKDVLPDSKVKTIERVGFDVAASCGMFVGV